MHGLCDSCEENADHLFDLTKLPEFRGVVRRLNYRKVCQICYDDLYNELQEEQQENKERRSETRYPLKIRINLEGISRTGTRFTYETFTEDVSISGARVVLNQPLEPGSVMKLQVPEINFESAVIIEVMWQDGTNQVAGLKLVEASDNWQKLVKEQAMTIR